MHSVIGSTTRLHPPEISLVRSRSHAGETLARSGLTLHSYQFGPSDGFVQAVVVGTRA